MPKPAIVVAVLTLVVVCMASAVSAQAPVAPYDGGYEKLSDGNRKIVRSIYEAQFGSANDRAHRRLLTRDEIAGLRKTDADWAAVYSRLFKQGKVAPPTLSQAMGNHDASMAGSRGAMTVVTTAAGERIMVSPGRASESVARTARAPVGAAGARTTVVKDKGGQAAAITDAGESASDPAAAISAAGGVSSASGSAAAR